jgi:hypothetical protein
MKFKMQDKQNQLIERISDKHLVVGVDIAQELHVARAVNFRGIIVGDPITFEIMSNRDMTVKRLVSAVNQINRWVDIVFPELRQVFKDVKGKGAIATLRLFPTPLELRSMKAPDIVVG